MARNYTDLSRRGLIKLASDYDQNNDAKLMQYFTENDKKYEGIRPMESVIERLDQVKETITESGSAIKSVCIQQADKMIDSVIDALTNAANIAGLDIDVEGDELL